MNFLRNFFYKLTHKQKDQPCRKHYFIHKPFSNCKDCGWSSDGLKIYGKNPKHN